MGRKEPFTDGVSSQQEGEALMKQLGLTVPFHYLPELDDLENRPVTEMPSVESRIRRIKRRLLHKGKSP